MQYPNEFELDNKRGEYCYKFSRQLKYITYEYAFDKAYKIMAELRRRGLDVVLPNALDKGTAKGWADFVRANDELIAYCELFGEELDCLLHPQFIGLEGKKVKCLTADGKIEEFFVTTWGKYAPYHIKRRNLSGRGGGKPIRKNYRAVEVINTDNKVESVEGKK
ncbi:hypothetical protein EKK58_09235 [Candidatus Dependentiae bacterium]|nr:MAG: hypothetical protein EKK58_09235 [Candidatus Dependentiae bacterium]